MRHFWKKLSLLILSGLCFGHATADTTTCPEAFLDIPVYYEASHCQVFASEPPASMSYHAKTGMEQMLSYYQSKLGAPQTQDKKRGRHILEFNDGNQIIILSNDNAGTQVDILIK